MSENEDEFTLYQQRVKSVSSKEMPKGFTELVRKESHLRSEDVQPSHSFWYYRPARGFPPKAIRYPSEYDGGDCMNIVCTQTGLKANEQKKLVQSWCEVLPGLEKVEYVWFSSRTTQALFDAACEMKNLRGLYIKWSGIKSIDSIARAEKLKYLHIGSSPSLAPLDPLSQCIDLEWLELENIRACADLGFLSDLIGLKGLSVTGDGNSNKYLRLNSLEPLINLQQLYWLSLTTCLVEEGKLLQLARLGALKYLFLSNKHKMEEIASLAGARPDVSCDLFQPVSRVFDFLACKKCGEHKMLLPVGKGKPWMCKNCDSLRIKKHVSEFNALASRFLNGSIKE